MQVEVTDETENVYNKFCVMLFCLWIDDDDANEHSGMWWEKALNKMISHFRRQKKEK